MVYSTNDRPQQANHSTTPRTETESPMLAILQPLGAMTGLLAIWLFLCDHTNEFAPWLFAAAILMLGVGVVME